MAKQFGARLAIIGHLEVPVLKIDLLKAQVVQLAHKALEEEVEEEREDLVALHSVHVRHLSFCAFEAGAYLALPILFIFILTLALVLLLLLHIDNAFASEVLSSACSQLFVHIVEQAEHLNRQMVLIARQSDFRQIHATEQINALADNVDYVQEHFLKHLVRLRLVEL